MEDVEIHPNSEFFTYIQKHTVYFHLTIYRSLSHTQKNLWQQTEWLATLLLSQEKLWLRFPAQASWSLFLGTFYDIVSHYMLIYSSFHRAQVPLCLNWAVIADRGITASFAFSALLCMRHAFAASHQIREYLFTAHSSLFSSAPHFLSHPFLAPPSHLSLSFLSQAQPYLVSSSHMPIPGWSALPLLLQIEPLLM